MKNYFRNVFSDIQIHHEIALPHRQQKHLNLQHPEIYSPYKKMSKGSGGQITDNYGADLIMIQIYSKVCPVNHRDAP